MASLAEYFPFWGNITQLEREKLESSAVARVYKSGTILHNGSQDCVGLFVIKSGQLRAKIASDEGKEMTVFRLFEGDICLFSASCIMKSLQFDLIIETEKNTELWVIPPLVYKSVMDESAAVANYTNELMASSPSEVIWLIEQVLWKSFDKRLAQFLEQENILEGSDILNITHEMIANHMGTAREVVTRMLKYFQSEGIVKLSRGKIELADKNKLKGLAG